MKTTTKEKTKRLNVTADESNQLKKLAREIRQLYSNTTALVRSAQEKGRAAIAEAILCGQKLNDAKKIVGHGGWGNWIKKNCKGVKERTAQNYMRLSKTQHIADLSDYNSLRQAYISVGIIEDNEPERTVTIVGSSAAGKTDTSLEGEDMHVAANAPAETSEDNVTCLLSETTPSRAGYVSPLTIGRVAKDTGEERIKRIRQLTVSLETELKALPSKHQAEARRIVAKLGAFVSESQTKTKGKKRGTTR